MSARLLAALERAGLDHLPAEPLARHTTLGVGGPVPVLIRPRDAGEVARAVAVLGELDFPWRALGAGSNLLADDDGLDFAVIATAGLAAEPRFDGTRVEVEAGAFLPRLVRLAAERGLAGLEWAIGVPGSAGGALRMNAGAWGSDMSRIVESVRAVTEVGGVALEAPFSPDFGYRRSGVGERTIVTRLVLRLAPGKRDEIVARTEHILGERRRTQPTAARSAGCAFRNPPGDSAGRLIEAAGLKGLQRGGAEVSALHANFVLNRGGASAADIRSLIAEVRERVLEATGVALETEIVEWRRAR